MTLPFWKDLTGLAKVETAYVVLARHPSAVARSLADRDGLSASESFRLWLAYTASALRLTEGNRRVVVEYDSLLDGAPSATNVLRALKVHIPCEQRCTDMVRSALDPQLRHHQATESGLPIQPGLVRAAHDLYEYCQTIAWPKVGVTPLPSELVREANSWVPARPSRRPPSALEQRLWARLSLLSLRTGVDLPGRWRA
jgi:hypothetical protein